MAYRPLIMIGDYAVPQPSVYIGNTADIVDSGRNANGVVIGSVIRHDVAKVEADFNYLTAEQWSNILKRFNPAYGGSFYNEVTFFNQVSADWETRNMYVGDRTTSGGAFKLDPVTGAVAGWVKPHLSLIEI